MTSINQSMKLLGKSLVGALRRFLIVRGGDLIMVAVSMFGTYKISKMVCERVISYIILFCYLLTLSKTIDRLFPAPRVDETTRGYITQILKVPFFVPFQFPCLF